MLLAQRSAVCGVGAESRWGACFCTSGAMQGYDVVWFIIALAKTVTPGGVPAGAGRRVFLPAVLPQCRAGLSTTGF
jgi:hypothetical protein